MAITKPSPKKADSPEWLRCQSTIRKMMHHLGKDALVYAKGALEHEDYEPERVKVFWENARSFFDDYEAKPATKVAKATTRAVKPEPKEETLAVPPVPEAKKEGNDA